MEPIEVNYNDFCGVVCFSSTTVSFPMLSDTFIDPLTSSTDFSSFILFMQIAVHLQFSLHWLEFLRQEHSFDAQLPLQLQRTDPSELRLAPRELVFK